MKLIEVACLIHLADQKLLLTESRKHPGTYYMPGGKIDPGETKEAALIRELKEELHIDIVPGTILHYGDFRAQAFNQPQDTEVIDYCYTAAFTGTLRASSEIMSYRFFSRAAYLQLPQQAPAVLKIMEALVQDGLLKE